MRDAETHAQKGRERLGPAPLARLVEAPPDFNGRPRSVCDTKALNDAMTRGTCREILKHIQERCELGEAAVG